MRCKFALALFVGAMIAGANLPAGAAEAAMRAAPTMWAATVPVLA